MKILVLVPPRIAAANYVPLIRVLSGLGHTVVRRETSSSISAFLTTLCERPAAVFAFGPVVRGLQFSRAPIFYIPTSDDPEATAGRARVVVTAGAAMTRRLRETLPGSDVVELPLTVIPDLIDPVALARDGDALTFCFAGGVERRDGAGVLLEAFSLHARKRTNDQLVMVCGAHDGLAGRARELGISGRVNFIEPTNENFAAALCGADVMVSPRLGGCEVPAEFCSLLASGRAVLATRVTAHTQVVGDAEVMFADPTPEQMAEGMRKLAGSADLRGRLANSARCLASDRFGFEAYAQAVTNLLARS